MYQNAPPHYNQGGYNAPQQQQYGGAGYYNQGGMQQMQQQPQAYPYHGAPSPVNAAYQRANAVMTGGGMPQQMQNGAPGAASNNATDNNATAGGGAGGGTTSASGLIRLTLRKPMGIVFEPMTDPHNPSQQRGVRICDLPRTGAAAMSQKLEVGDELLSINDKTMSRLTFDEIMDFIIEADKERVDLLFRRPGKDKLNNVGAGGNNDRGLKIATGGAGGKGNNMMPLSPMGLAGIGSNNSNSVKWIDEKSDMGGKLATNHRDEGGRSKKPSTVREMDDDPSVDDTYNDGYTVESQSQYTMETYEEEDRHQRGGRNKDSRRQNDSRRDDNRGKRKGSSSKNNRSNNDPMESSGFLDLLIDTLCTSVMGRDARDMCGDRSEDRKNASNRGGYPEDDEFTLDDGTYATYEDNPRQGRNNGGRRNDEDESFVSEEDRTFVTTDDDGTRTLESKDNVGNNNKSAKMKMMQNIKDHHHKDGKKSKSSSKEDSVPRDVDMNGNEDDGLNIDQFHHHSNSHGSHHNHHRSNADPPQHNSDQMTAPDPPTKSGQSNHHNHSQQNLQQPVVPIVDIMGHESAIASQGIALPLKELEYDDRVDYAADVSVMESLGGPSLLVERARHENAVHSGADRASFEQNHHHSTNLNDPELSELVALHGSGFHPDPGMTREETAFRDPYKFYEFAVCALLRENEPEKVRLLSKLMAKYRGRERHLINKLSARYNKDNGKGGGDGGIGGSGGDDEAADQTPAVGKSSSSDNNRLRSNSSDQNSTTKENLANKPSMSGMEKIHEGEDEEDQTAGSSALNDPSRANIAAIETAKKKMENSVSKSDNDKVKAAQDTTGVGGSPKNKAKSNADNDGWPPAMADPWGTGGGDNADDHGHANDEDASRPLDDEGSYSDGSSYSGDESAIDGTSPAIIAQVSELLNYVYGKTSVAGQIDRVSTIMRAYEGREAVLLELLETKALIKANADSNRDAADLPMSLRNSPGLNTSPTGGNKQEGAATTGDGGNNNTTTVVEQKNKLTPQTPISVLTAPTMAPGQPISPASVQSPKEGVLSPSAATTNTANTTASKKKKKNIFGGFFGGKKKDKVNNKGQPSNAAAKTNSSPAKGNRTKTSKKGQPLNNNEDDRSI